MNIHEYANELIKSYYLNNKGHLLTFHLILFFKKNTFSTSIDITVYYLLVHF